MTQLKRRESITLRSTLGDMMPKCSRELVYTLSVNASLSKVVPTSPLVQTVRKYFTRFEGPIMVSLDYHVLDKVRNMLLRKINVEEVREAFVIVDHEYHDAMFMGGVDSRRIIEDDRAEPKTAWILMEAELNEFLAEDPDCILKAFDLFDRPDRPVI